MGCKVLSCDVKWVYVICSKWTKTCKTSDIVLQYYEHYSAIWHSAHTQTLYLAHGVIDIHNVFTLNSQPRHPLLEMWVVLCLSAQV